MNASILELRYKTREILRALENRESVVILYHGKPKGTIAPLPGDAKIRVCEHPFFGMLPADGESVSAVMRKLRSGRDDI